MFHHKKTHFQSTLIQLVTSMQRSRGHHNCSISSLNNNDDDDNNNNNNNNNIFFNNNNNNNNNNTMIILFIDYLQIQKYEY